MATMLSLPTTDTLDRTNNKTFRYWAAALLIVEFLLMFVPMIILGSAIGWPASLDQPASVNLPLILEQAGAVQAGYFAYLIYSFLIIPVALVISALLTRDGRPHLLLQIANGFAIGSAVLRVLGIIRWLTAMPVLAEIYTHPNTSESTREATSAMYEMLNAYAGSVGEILGVSLFAAIWVALTSIVVLRERGLPRWLGFFGLATAAALLVTVLSVFGIDTGLMITVSVTFIQFWWLCIALIILFRPRSVARFAANEAQV